MTFSLKVALLSDASFASGEGIAGQLDNDVEHDTRGLPTIGAKRLGGLLADEGRELLDSIPNPHRARWEEVHQRVFGVAGSGLTGQGSAHISTARLPAVVRRSLASDPALIASCTTVRRQTVIDPTTGSPKPRLLRATKVVVKGVWFVARVDLETSTEVDLETQKENEERDRAWLATCASLLRRGGLRRNRGRGKLACSVWMGQKDNTADWRKPVIAVLRKEA